MKQYGAILIDPPWKFRVWNQNTSSVGGTAASHYPTMAIEELKEIPLQQFMAKDCAVFIWTCWPTLLDAIDLATAYGLTYKTCAFNWVKLNKTQSDTPFTGMGYWTRANSEPCLLFTKGSPRRKSKDVPQMLIDWQGGMFADFETETIATRIGAHSQKPDAVYERIEALVDGDYLEIFARQRRAGWDAIGNGVDGRDIRDVLAEAAR